MSMWCIAVSPDINNNICDTVPLDKLKYYSANKQALPYITWGLIWDLKTETQEIPKIFQISKLKRRDPSCQIYPTDCHLGFQK